MTFENEYDQEIYKYLESEECIENPSLLIPYLRNTLVGKRAYKKAYKYISALYSTEYASNVLKMVTEGTIGICEPEQYIDKRSEYGTFTNIDVVYELMAGINSYEVKQFVSPYTLLALITRVVTRELQKGRTELRLDYLVEALALINKGARAINKRVPEHNKMSNDTLKHNIERGIVLIIDALSSSKGTFNPVSIVIRDKFDWEINRSNFRVFICDDITLSYDEYLRMLKTFMRIYNRKVKSGIFNYPKVYVIAKVRSNAYQEVHDIIFKHSMSKYTYLDVTKSLNNSGFNVMYSGVDAPEVRNKIREMLIDTEFVEDDEIDATLEDIYKCIDKNKGTLEYADEDLGYVLEQTTDKLKYPNHALKRVYYPRYYGFSNWQSVLSVSYLNFKNITLFRNRKFTYETMKDRLEEAVINAQMLNYIKKYWANTDVGTPYKTCIVCIQNVPKKMIPMVSDIVDSTLQRIQSAYQYKLDFVVQDDRSFAYIERSIKKAKKKQEDAEKWLR